MGGDSENEIVFCYFVSQEETTRLEVASFPRRRCGIVCLRALASCTIGVALAFVRVPTLAGIVIR